MLYLGNVLKFVIDRFYECTLPQTYLVSNAHKRVLHIVLYFGKQLDSIYKQAFKKRFANISLVAEKLPLDILYQCTFFKRFPVIYATRRENEIKDFPLVIDYKMQLEPKEPAHRALATTCKPVKCLVYKDALVTAYTQRRAVHKTYSRALSKQNLLDECRQLQQDFLLQFHKTVVRYCSWEEMPAMLADIMQIVMLEATEPSRMKMYEDYDYLCITHTVGLATVSFAVLRSFEHRFFLLLIKKLAEFVCQTENFSNFILGEHSGKELYVIF